MGRYTVAQRIQIPKNKYGEIITGLLVKFVLIWLSTSAFSRSYSEFNR